MPTVSLRNLDKLDALIEPMLRVARVPGAAIAVVASGKVVYAKGFGYRDLRSKKPLTADTIYPIASTTKTINATLLGMLVDEGRLEWDAPVQRYLPHFRLRDAVISARVTVRDLVTMRTGLPRHDWVWSGSSKTRAQLVEHIAHLDLSADFRRRFQYCNLTVTAAGHIAEVVAQRSWEALVQQRIFRPLAMRHTSVARPTRGNVTLCYHEDAQRKLVRTNVRSSEATAPAGGSVHSTVGDMARWVLFNLKGGVLNGRRLIRTDVLGEIHAPQVVIGDRPLAELPADAAYAMGWMVDSYNGHKRVSHGGYLHDVNSSVMFFPGVDVGMVSFINFGCPRVAELINHSAFDVLLGLTPARTIEQKMADYEAKIEQTSRRNASVPRVSGTRPSHPLGAYHGKYTHAGYGEIKIQRRGRKLFLKRNDLLLGLKHWHYDVWVADDDRRWPIHQSHAFDRTRQIQFHLDTQGEIAALSMPMEPAVAPIRFARQQ